MKNKIIQSIKENLTDLEGDSGIGGHPQLPKFELIPRDFIAFADLDMKGEKLNSHKLVNVTSNLKRALDCQLDFLFSLLNIDELYRKKKLGIDKKLEFIKVAGVFNAKSLKKLNQFRNRLEHHYEIPNVEDVDVYFDLVSAFITISENLVSNLMSQSEVCFCSPSFPQGSFISSEIDYDKPSITLKVGRKENETTYNVSLNKSSSPQKEDISNFAFLLKCHILFIHLFNGAITCERLVADLEREI